MTVSRKSSRWCVHARWRRSGRIRGFFACRQQIGKHQRRMKRTRTNFIAVARLQQARLIAFWRDVQLDCHFLRNTVVRNAEFVWLPRWYWRLDASPRRKFPFLFSWEKIFFFFTMPAELATNLQRRTVFGAFNCAVETLHLLRNIVSHGRWTSVESLIALLKETGRELTNVQPTGKLHLPPPSIDSIT